MQSYYEFQQMVKISQRSTTEELHHRTSSPKGNWFATLIQRRKQHVCPQQACGTNSFST
ncbi:hypothetical protein [Shimazuella kribbensis]|uniref:hypothetical protein n=1 Tax=Shimazuella kribbensis TaxID=139808 RepID=UPI0003FDA791|nr:hypothetical protein [Shimazuella kribbensis]